jgi:uncharacterized protein YjbI with pentapeptide repeats
VPIRLRQLSLLVAYLALGLAFVPPSPAGVLDQGDHSGEDHSFDRHRREDIDGIILSDANLESIDFTDSSLRDAMMISAFLLDAVLRNVTLPGSITTAKPILLVPTMTPIPYSTHSSILPV